MTGNLNKGWLKNILDIIYEKGQDKAYDTNWITEEILKTPFGKTIKGKTPERSCNMYFSQNPEIFESVGTNEYKLKQEFFKSSLSTKLSNSSVKSDVQIVENPIFHPKNNYINRGDTIKITCSTAQTDIFYTTDESFPDNTSILYEPTKGIQLYTDTTIKAIAYDKSGNKSKHETEDYTILKKNIDQEKKKKVEAAAVDVVVKHYDRLGYEHESVESENVGWDYNFYRKEEHLKVEIKGNSGKKINVELSPNEYSKMQMPEHTDNYRIAIVTDALSKNPNLSILKIEQNNLIFDFGLEKEISTSEPTSLKITEK